MDLTTELHLVAGLGAAGLGAGLFLYGPRRARNVLFALLCACFCLWNLGMVGNRFDFGPGIPWNQIFLLGACFSGPVALHFVVRFTGITGPRTRVLLAVAYPGAGLLWLTSWTPLYASRPAWNLTALVFIGVILGVALGFLIRKSTSLPRGAERTAFRWLIAGALAAILGGISDFLPRGGTRFLKVGPLFLMFFLLIICAVVLRYRFLDIHVFLARGITLLLGAFLFSSILFVVARFSGTRLFPLFLATLLLATLAAPLRNLLASGTGGGLFRTSDPLARSLMAMSRRLAAATDLESLWGALDEGGQPFAELRVAIYLHHPGDDRFRPVYPDSSAERFPDLSFDTPLARLLELERAPLTRRLLEREAGILSGERRKLVDQGLEDLQRSHFQLIVPLQRNDALAGWVGVGGRVLERHLTGEVAAAFLAVGNQAMASFERIQANEAARKQAALAAVGRMAAGLAHEIRNPLGAIRGASQVLDGDTSTERAREMRQVIQEETGRLGRVVGEFLEYARPAAPERKPVDLEALARRVLRTAETAGNGIRHEIRIAPGTPHALGDRDQLQRALANLVQNAREAAGPDGTIRIEAAPAGNNRVRIRVEDNGPGIPDDQIDQLFQPFHTTKPGGTGLGLALVHRVAEGHGGTIEVEGRPGRGAVFTLVLPAAEGA